MPRFTNLAYNTDRFSHPLAHEHAKPRQQEVSADYCPWCGDHCTCTADEDRERHDDFIEESWSRGMWE